jgi:hypothetical protein
MIILINTYLDWLLCHSRFFYIINSFALKTNRTFTSEFMMVLPTRSLADMHAKETNTINTLRT